MTAHLQVVELDCVLVSVLFAERKTAMNHLFEFLHFYLFEKLVSKVALDDFWVCFCLFRFFYGLKELRKYHIFVDIILQKIRIKIPKATSHHMQAISGVKMEFIPIFIDLKPTK